MTPETKKMEMEAEVDKSGSIVSVDHNLSNGIDYVPNVDGNVKEDVDSSYVFISQNGGISDDPIECDHVKNHTEANKPPCVKGAFGGSESIFEAHPIIDINEDNQPKSVESGQNLEVKPQSFDNLIGMPNSPCHEVHELSEGDIEVERQSGSYLDANVGKEVQSFFSEEFPNSNGECKPDQGVESAEIVIDSNYRNHPRATEMDSKLSEMPYHSVCEKDSIDSSSGVLLKENYQLLSDSEAVVVFESTDPGLKSDDLSSTIDITTESCADEPIIARGQVMECASNSCEVTLETKFLKEGCDNKLCHIVTGTNSVEMPSILENNKSGDIEIKNHDKEYHVVNDNKLHCTLTTTSFAEASSTAKDGDLVVITSESCTQELHIENCHVGESVSESNSGLTSEVTCLEEKSGHKLYLGESYVDMLSSNIENGNSGANVKSSMECCSAVESSLESICGITLEDNGVSKESLCNAADGSTSTEMPPIVEKGDCVDSETKNYVAESCIETSRAESSLGNKWNLTLEIKDGKEESEHDVVVGASSLYMSSTIENGDFADAPTESCVEVSNEKEFEAQLESSPDSIYEVTLEVKGIKEEHDHKLCHKIDGGSSIEVSSIMEIDDSVETAIYREGIESCTESHQVLDSTREVTLEVGSIEEEVEHKRKETKIKTENCHRLEEYSQFEVILADEKMASKFDIESNSVSLNDSSVEVNNRKMLPTDGDVESSEAVILPQDGLVADGSNKNKSTPEIERKPLLVRVPKYDDENLRELIRHAQLQVELKTKSRDAIQAEIHDARTSCKELREKFEDALANEREARDILRSKRQEIDSHQFIIDRAKSAKSVEDIKVKILNIEHMMQHETLHLKEEKQLIREIKQLKQLREEISSSLGQQEEVQHALEEKEQIEELLKVLRKEVDSLRNDLFKAEGITKVAKKQFLEESNKLNQLQDQFRSADIIRQDAYAHLQNLRKQLREKNKYFYNYKDDLSAANDLALKKDRESILQHCTEQVERFFNLWNNSEEFRRDYVRCNMRSTIRRFGTLDGCSLAPNEQPMTLPQANSKPMDKETIISSQAKIDSSTEVNLMKEKVEVNSRKHKAASRKFAEADISATSEPARVSGKVELLQHAEQGQKVSDEEEATHKIEEMRKQEEKEAKLKEQRRLEEIARTKEGMERKKRLAEKNRIKAEIKAKKEAEMREKEREKRLRKREKKAVRVAVAIVREEACDKEAANKENCGLAPAMESETSEIAICTKTKRSQKALAQFSKLKKAKAIPPPLRNRGKKKMQRWMWVGLAALIFMALFLWVTTTALSRS